MSGGSRETPPKKGGWRWRQLARAVARIATRIPLSAAVALLATCVAFAATYLALDRVLGESQIAGGIASLWFGAGLPVQRSLERQFRAWLPAPVNLPTIGGFQRPWWKLAIVAFVAVAAVQLLVPVVSFGGGPATAFNRNVSSLLAIAPPAVAFLVGTLTGSRSDRYGLPLIVVAVLAAYGVAGALTPVALDLTGRIVLGAEPAPPGMFDPPACPDPGPGPGPDQPQASQSPAPSVTAPGGIETPPIPPPGVGPGGPPVASTPAAGSPAGTEMPPIPDCVYGRGLDRFILDNPLPLLLAAGLLGYWRGRRVRLTAYVGELLGRLPPPTRDSIVALAHEEAERLARSTVAHAELPRVTPTDGPPPG